MQEAAAATGIGAGVPSQIVAQIGGEGSLSAFASMVDNEGDRNPVNDIMGMASRLFGKK